MPRTDNEIRITPSVLDRLLDFEPEKSREAQFSRARSLRDLKNSVKRDLEWLLNTRQSNIDLPSDLKEVNRSVGAYGLPDFSSWSLRNPADVNRLRQEIESVISRFEPRLEAVKIIVDPIGPGEKILFFRIDARLRVEPAPEPVAFASTLRLASGECSMKEI